MSKNQSPSRTLSEWFRLVTECRQSGLSDSAWCLMNGIPRSTFSQAVKRLQKASYAVASKTTPTDPLDFTSKQEVVKIDIEQDNHPAKYTETVPYTSDVPVSNMYLDNSHTIEIQIGASSIRLSNDADPTLVKVIIHSLAGGNAYAC